MGLIHTRASKQRDKAEADLAREQAELARRDNLRDREEAAGDSIWLQPTVGGVLRKLAERHAASREDGDSAA